MKKFIKKHIAEFVLIICVSAVFCWHISVSKNVSLEQVKAFIRASVHHQADRIFQLSRDDIGQVKSIAYLLGNLIVHTPSDTNQILKEIEENTDFDHVRFIDIMGQDHTSTGRIADCSDRDYFQKAMQGQSGITSVITSRINDDRLIGFYSPVFANNSIIGVIVGFYSSVSMEKMLTQKYYTEDITTYLIDENGEIASASYLPEAPTNIHSFIDDPKVFTEEQRKIFKYSLEYKKESIITFYENGKETLGIITPINYRNWFLFQAVPHSAIDIIYDQYRYPSSSLLISLLFVFSVYIIYLVINNRLKRARLVKENLYSRYVSEGIKSVFSSFVLVDLESGAYEFVSGTQKDYLPNTGKFDDFVETIVDMQSNASEKKDVRHQLSIDNIADVLKDGNVYFNFLSHVVDKVTNKESWYSYSTVCILRGKIGIPRIILLCDIDVTSGYIKEVEMRNIMESAITKAEKANNAKSQFLMRFSNDIKNPLNAIIGMSSVAVSHIDNSDRIVDYLQKINYSGKHLLGIVHELLDMSRIENNDIVIEQNEFNVLELVDNIKAITNSQAMAKDLIIDFQISNIIWENLIGDKRRIEQIVNQLMSNAIKFTDVGGFVGLTITESESQTNSNEVIFTINCEDSGIGMDEETQANMFNAYYRAVNADYDNIEGTGLGMFIIKKIVDKMGGTINVESTLNNGTSVQVVFSLKKVVVDSEQKKLHVAKNVFVLDDDLLSCINITDLLNYYDIRNNFSLDVDSAINMFTKESKKIDLLITSADIEKNKLKQFIDLAKSGNSELKVAVLSNGNFVNYRDVLPKDVDVVGELEKPVLSSRLYSIVEASIGNLKIVDNEGNVSYSSFNFSDYKVLLVEDNPYILEISKDILESIGVTTETAVNGKEAFEIYSASPEGCFDMIIMDIKMPIMNGFEVAKGVRALNRVDSINIPIVAVLTDDEEDCKSKIEGVGMNGFIRKPISVDIIKKTLRTYLKPKAKSDL